ncbi:MAG: acyl-CoA dehydrogenase family protein [Chloroflexota bacterium]
MNTKNLNLTEQQAEKLAAFKAFSDEHLAPRADEFDRNETLPRNLVSEMVQAGCWGGEIPQAYSGIGMDAVTYGLLNEEIGRGCANTRNLIGVQGMVSSAILRWGSKEQKAQWLPKMAAGETVVAFALTEPEIGSDAKNINTSAALDNGEYVLNGHKKWISFGQNADLFLLLAQCDGRVTAFLVERERPGFSTTPINGLLGFRGSMLAELHLENCRVPAENIVGRVGLGLTHVAGYGLSHGRYSTAWGCVGLAQAALEASLRYTSTRRQFDAYLKEHQLIQGLIADMAADVTAARLLCLRAAEMVEANGLGMVTEMVGMAKYFASKVAFRAANDAVQLHGANGCGPDYPVQRYLRDAKIAEIVEGSSQIQQLIIAKYAYRGV